MSMPVGRITYLHLEPLSFEEFLRAQGTETLLTYIQEIIPPFTIPMAIHQSLQDHFKRYLQIGGMPAAVSRWVKDQSIESVTMLQQDLLATYRDDFFKYKGRIDVQKLDTLLKAIPSQLGQKFMYSKADPSIQAPAGKQILSLFNKARLCHIIQSSAGNGIPLAAEVKNKAFKQIFLDIGLINRFLGAGLSLSKAASDGRTTEQIVGQMLRCLFPFYIEPSLYYWQREEKGSNAEIDYLIEHKNQIIPIEVKSGSTGTLKSLHLFMDTKHLSFAVRINNDIPSITPVKIKNTSQTEIFYTLLSIPFYLTGQIHRLLDESI
jgi:predicted AAA+ superfamily ATPase